MPEPDPRVTDPQALDEIELYGEVVIAASSSSRPLTASELDEVLGVPGGLSQPGPGSGNVSR